MICHTQFFAWIGWFPILFYTSIWVGEIYTREQLALGRSQDDPELEQDATRAGSRALFFNAVVNLATSIVLPFLVSSSGIQGSQPAPIQSSHRESSARGTDNTSRFADKVGDYLDKARAWTRVPARMRLQLPIPGFTLIRAWMLGQIMFTTTMFATYFARTTLSANLVIGLNGFCWAVAQWAPFSLVSRTIQTSRFRAGLSVLFPAYLSLVNLSCWIHLHLEENIPPYRASKLRLPMMIYLSIHGRQPPLRPTRKRRN